MGARFCRQLPRRLRSPIAADEAVRTLGQRLARREDAFLDLVEHAIFRNPGEPVPRAPAAGWLRAGRSRAAGPSGGRGGRAARAPAGGRLPHGGRVQGPQAGGPRRHRDRNRPRPAAQPAVRVPRGVEHQRQPRRRHPGAHRPGLRARLRGRHAAGARGARRRRVRQGALAGPRRRRHRAPDRVQQLRHPGRALVLPGRSRRAGPPRALPVERPDDALDEPPRRRAAPLARTRPAPTIPGRSSAG